MNVCETLYQSVKWSGTIIINRIYEELENRFSFTLRTRMVKLLLTVVKDS